MTQSDTVTVTKSFYNRLQMQLQDVQNERDALAKRVDKAIDYIENLNKVWKSPRKKTEYMRTTVLDSILECLEVAPQPSGEGKDKEYPLTNADKEAYLIKNGWQKVEGKEFIWDKRDADGAGLRFGLDSAVNHQWREDAKKTSGEVHG